MNDELAALKASMLQEIRDDVKAMRKELYEGSLLVARMDERLTSLEKSRTWVGGVIAALIIAVAKQYIG